jgi:hypothetical protein
MTKACTVSRVLARLRQAIVAGALAAALACLFLLAGARWGLSSVEGPVAEGGWTRRSRAVFVAEGFYPAELDHASGRPFSWSGEAARLSFPHLRRARAYRVTLTIRGGRPANQPAADLEVAVDGIRRVRGQVSNEPSAVAFEIPRASVTGAVVTLTVAQPFIPGAQDRRSLGVIVDQVTLTPVNGAFVPAGRVVLLLGIAAFLIMVAVRWCGVRGRFAAATAVILAAGLAWLLLTDAAFIGPFPSRLVGLTAAALAAGALIGFLRSRWPTVGGVPEWAVAAGLILALSILKAGLFAHPSAIVGDGIFQVHRAQLVHGGNYFFTSVTPKPFFEFPYPVALYVFALPFWSWFPTELDLLRLLRTVAITADALTGLLLYGAMRRQWNSRSAAFACAILWPLAKAPMEALSNANLTNLFGQSMFGAALAACAWLAAVARPSIATTAAVLILLSTGFLSHFGTVSVGVAMMGFTGLVLVAHRGDARRMGVRVFVILIAALAVSWVLYYSHFTEVYRRTWTAVSAGDSDDSSKIVAAPAVKLSRWWAGIGDDYGRPGVAVMIAALGGLIWLVRQRPAGAGLVLLAWMAAWIALSALGVLTPFTLRANLAAAPAFIALAALGLGAIASRSPAGAVVAAALGALVAWDGLQLALRAIQLSTSR